MSKTLKIADNLSLPSEIVTQTLLVVGKRGSGKSNTAARIVEQLHHAGCPFVVLDPVDNWYGLKASRDGRGPGLSDIYVFGGAHADLPIEPGGGELLADVLCEHRTSMILSVKHFTGGERSRFMTAFAQRLLQKWAGGVLHVVLEEAHEFAPQSIPKGEQAEKMLGAFKRLWKLGRASGIGGTAVTQRPASLSKDITTQAEILVAHRTIGPQDIDAIKGWIRYHQESEDTLGQLATLKTGEAFVYGPEFPEAKPIGLRRVAFYQRETFDSTATPKPGEHRVEPKMLAPVDLERLRTKMAATIDRAKADDPKELRRQLAAKDAELAKLRSAKPVAAPAPAAKAVEVSVLTEADREKLDELHATVRASVDVVTGKITDAVKRAFEPYRKQIEATERKMAAILGKVALAQSPRPVVASPTPTVRRVPAPTPSRAATNGHGAGTTDLGKCERKILQVLAQHGPCESNRLALLSGYAFSGGFRNSLSALRGAGYMVGDNTRTMEITDAGVTALGDVDPLPTGAALVEHWMHHSAFGKAERAVLGALVESPDGLTAEQLCAATGYEFSGGFRNTLSALRTAGVLVGRNTETMQAHPDLLA